MVHTRLPALLLAITLVICGLVAATLLPASATAATAATPGVVPAPSRTTATPNAADQVTFYVVLKSRDRRAQSALRAVSDPHSRSYRHFLSRSTIRNRFGGSQQAIAAVKRSALAARLSPSLDPTGLFMRVSGTVKELERWIDGSIELQEHQQTPTSSTRQIVRLYIAARGHLPAQLTGKGLQLLPVYMKTKTYTVVRSTTTGGAKPIQKNQGTWIGGCKAARTVGTYSFAQLAKAYGVDRLSHSRATGHASRMAIIAAGEGYSSTSLRRSAKCFGERGRTFQRARTDGMVGNLPELGEGALDTQTAQAVMPAGSTITVIESSPSALTWYLAWAKAFSLKPLPDAISLSYGICEQNLLKDGSVPPELRRLSDRILVRLGLAGTTATSSAGDDGSSGCFQASHTTPLAVEYPASSPFITSVGGSRLILRKNNTRSREVVWHDVNRFARVHGKKGPLPTSGGGGGTSTVYGQPWFQRQAGIDSRHRTVPDVAMHASFGPGWPVYLGGPAAVAFGMPKAGFTAVAGTSASSPYFASNIAVVAAMQRQAGLPALGHIAPALYDVFDQRGHGGFYDIHQDTNDIYGVGCCRASRGYDLASGLGAPSFATLPGELRRPG